MRVTTIGKLVVLAGVVMMVWSALGVLQAIASVSGGSTGPHPVMDFAVDHLFVPGFLAFFFGLFAWIGGGQVKVSFSFPKNKGFSLTERIKRNQEFSSTKT